MRRFLFPLGVALMVINIGAWAYVARHEIVSTSQPSPTGTPTLSDGLFGPGEAVEKLERTVRALRRTLRATGREVHLLRDAPVLWRIRKGPVRHRHDTFAPRDGHLLQFLLIRQSVHIPPVIVTSWVRGHIDDPLERGIWVWQARRTQRKTETWNSTTLRWAPVYVIDLPLFHGLPELAGPPNRMKQVRTFGYELSVGTRAHDVTGDGRPEVMVIDQTGGSGACSVSRIFTSDRVGFRQIYARSVCDGSVSFARRGKIRVVSAVYPKGCTAAHGCGFKTVFLRWTGGRWVVVHRHVELDRPFRH